MPPIRHELASFLGVAASWWRAQVTGAATTSNNLAAGRSSHLVERRSSSDLQISDLQLLSDPSVAVARLQSSHEFDLQQLQPARASVAEESTNRICAA